MPKITKIYTRKGDDGTTALGSKLRVPKDDLRVSAYGTIDELNSLIGLALSYGLDEKLADVLPGIQNTLFHLGSDLAFPAEDKEAWKVPRIAERHIDELEDLIDELNEIVGPLQNFILPGGSPGAAVLQVARAVCRRAEGSIRWSRRHTPQPPRISPYSVTCLATGSLTYTRQKTSAGAGRC